MTKDRRGGAIFSDGTSSRYEDCIISNNASFLGTIYLGKVVRCGVYGNYASWTYDPSTGNPYSTGPAGESCSWYGCVIDGNCGNATMFNPIRIEFCTIGDGNFCYDKNGRRFAQAVFRDTGAACRMFNSVILGSGNTTYGTTLYATNCLFRTGITTIGWDTEPYASNRGGCIMTDVGNIATDGRYAPVYGSYAGIDRGDLSLCDGTLPLDVDLNGTQRIYNGTIDIGAVEFDRRARYAKKLGRGTAVVVASPSAREEDDGVKLPSGEISGTLRRGTYNARFTVTGAGTLSVYCGDSLVGEYVASASPQTARFEAAADGAQYRLSFEPDAENPGGYALVSTFGGTIGMMLVFR